jgi:transmembrane sensor
LDAWTVADAPSNVITLGHADPDANDAGFPDGVMGDLSGAFRSTRPLVHWTHRRVRAAALGLAVAALAAGALLYFRSIPPVAQQYSSTPTAQRAIKLTDGSLITLNRNSRVTVRFSAQERYIELERGEVFFDVAPDASRPFRVLTDSATVEAVGTQFDVERGDEAAAPTTVSVLDGRVIVSSMRAGSTQRVSGEPSPTRPVQVSAGEQVRVTGDGELHRPPAPELARALCWRTGRYEYRDVPLGTVLAMLNRCSTHHVHVMDASASARLFSGPVLLDHPDPIVELLEGDSGLRVVRHGDAIEVSSRDDPPTPTNRK